jgi:hypothetical protein
VRQELREEHVDDVVDRDHQPARVEQGDDVVRDVEDSDPGPQRGGRHRDLLADAVPRRLHLDDSPTVGELGEEVEIVARDQQHEPARRVELGDLAEQTLQVGADAKVGQLAGINTKSPHSPAF